MFRPTSSLADSQPSNVAAARFTNRKTPSREMAIPSGADSISERMRCSERSSAASVFRRSDTSWKNATEAGRPSISTALIEAETGTRAPSARTMSTSTERGGSSPARRARAIAFIASRCSCDTRSIAEVVSSTSRGQPRMRTAASFTYSISAALSLTTTTTTPIPAPSAAARTAGATISSSVRSPIPPRIIPNLPSRSASLLLEGPFHGC
jgi:hypothetical protein